MRGLRLRLWQIGLLLGFLALWEWASKTGRIDPFFFSKPSDILARVWVVSRCMCKRLCTGGIPLLKHLL